MYRRRLVADDADTDEDKSSLWEKCKGESDSSSEPQCPYAQAKYDTCMKNQTAQDKSRFDEEGTGRVTFTLMKSHDQIHQKI